MDNYSLIYKEAITQEQIEKSGKSHIANCWVESTSDKGAHKLLYVMAYMSLMKVPQHFLEDGRQYSIEDICSYQEGVIGRVGLHDFLTAIGKYSREDGNDDPLKEVIQNVVYPEIAALLEFPVFDTYLALCVAYAYGQQDSEAVEYFKELNQQVGINKYILCYSYFTERYGI